MICEGDLRSLRLRLAGLLSERVGDNLGVLEKERRNEKKKGTTFLY